MPLGSDPGAEPRRGGTSRLLAAFPGLLDAVITAAEWIAFTAGVRAGEFD